MTKSSGAGIVEKKREKRTTRITGVRIEPHTSETGISWLGNSSQQDAARQLSFTARDADSWSVAILHPDFLPASVTVPKGVVGESESPIRIRLERGHPMKLRLRLPRLRRDSTWRG